MKKGWQREAIVKAWGLSVDVGSSNGEEEFRERENEVDCGY